MVVENINPSATRGNFKRTFVLFVFLVHILRDRIEGKVQRW